MAKLSALPTLVLVDDEVDTLDALKRLFRNRFDIAAYSNPEDALASIESLKEISVIVSDQRMPQMKGAEFLKRSRSLFPDAVRILLTGYTDIESAVDAINDGHIYRYMAKPWDPTDLLQTVEEAAQKYKLLKELKLSNEIKSNFIAMINHELKTPLTVLSAHVQLLSEDAVAPSVQSSLVRIQSSVNRLESVITRAVDALRVLADGRSSVEKSTSKRVDLKAWLEANISMLTNGVVGSGNSTDRVTVRNLASALVDFDESHFRVALREVLDNAHRFADPAEPKVEVGWDPSDLTLTVSNPCAPEVQQRLQAEVTDLLEPFRTGHSALHHKRGLGLGLPIAAAHAELARTPMEIELEDSQFKVIFQFLKAK